MGSRLAVLLGDGGEAIVEKLWIGTFHTHCLRILKHEWAHLYGKGGYFQLADENWQKRVARAILGDADWMAHLARRVSAGHRSVFVSRFSDGGTDASGPPGAGVTLAGMILPGAT